MLSNNNNMGKKYVLYFSSFPFVDCVFLLLLFVPFSGEHNFDRTSWLLGHDDRSPYHHVGTLNGHAELRAAHIRGWKPWRPAAAAADFILVGQLSGP